MAFFLIARSIVDKDFTLKFKEPYAFRIEVDDGLLIVSDADLSIHVFARNVDKLKHELKSQIIMMWKSYVLSGKPLSQDAEMVAERLKELVEVNPGQDCSTRKMNWDEIAKEYDVS